MNIWTVYNKPIDMPGKFVARRFWLEEPTQDLFAHEDIEQVRQWVIGQARKQGIDPIMLPRDPSDDPVIMELWV